MAEQLAVITDALAGDLKADGRILVRLEYAGLFGTGSVEGTASDMAVVIGDAPADGDVSNLIGEPCVVDDAGTPPNFLRWFYPEAVE